MAYIVDGVYQIDENPPIEVQGISTGVWGIVGTFSKGPVNTPTFVTSLNDLKNTFGGADESLTGYLGALTAFGQGATQAQVVRILGTGATKASVIVEDSTPAQVFTGTYKTEGTGGNLASITVSSGTKTGTFKITVTDGDTVEVFDNVITQQPETPISGANLLSNLNSQVIDFSQPATPNANAPVNGSYPLVGGSNGAAPAVAAYVGSSNPNTGLQALSGATPAVNLVFLAGQATDSGIIGDLETFCEANKCMAAACDPQGTTLSQAKSDTANLDTDRVVFTWPWQQMYVQELDKVVTVPPTGYWVGEVGTLFPHESPGNKTLVYTEGPEFAVSNGDITTALDPSVRIVPIGVPIPRGGIGIRSGATLSQNPATNPVYRRRMDDFISVSIDTALGQFVDEPITDELMDDQSHTVSNFLDPLTTANNEAGTPMIASYSVQCDSSNNPSSVTQGDMTIIDTRVQLFNINRFLLFRTQIGAGVITTTSQSQ